MKLFTNSVWVIVTMLLILKFSVAEAVSTNSDTIAVCALLPDKTSSSRYVLFDQPTLTAAFKAADVPATIYNAEGDAQKQLLQAKECLAKGAKVVLLDALDLESGEAITNILVNADAKVIAYDRLVPGSKALYYVSFHSVEIGRLLGKGLVKALKKSGEYSQNPVIAELNGAKTDNNAILFKEGYDKILDPLYKAGRFKKANGGDQWTDWNPELALTIFGQMLALNSNQIDGVLAPNDNIASSVISMLQKAGLRKMALTGQDATIPGVQHILTGWQTGTVYKPIKMEAAAAAKVAIKILRGKRVVTNSKVSGIPAVLLKSIWITKANYKKVFRDGFLQKSDVCTVDYAIYCK